MSPRAKFIIGTAAWLAIRAWAIPAFFIGWIVGTLTAWVRAGFDMATTVDSMPLARMIERNRPRVEEDQKIQPELADEEEYDWEDEYDWGGRAMSGKIDWRTIVPATHGPTGFDMTTDRARWRVFNSHLHWVNKASTWMFDGDDCFDSTGSLLVTGRDFAEATFPVVIARRLDR